MRKIIHYKIKWGDKLNIIADKFGLTSEEIMYINRINEIYVGQIIIIPTPKIKKIKSNPINRTLLYYLTRQKAKKHLYNFYYYKKITS
jgi:LysM repeat protein